ncbi:hypothetical protein SDC9_112246 [bioreactor metagenome]|uniref:Uncharacterized protein n=1 Tax=bioreactor metagenome TaxID=1076179 RepID=A0A645BLD5_9ZZZZ
MHNLIRADALYHPLRDEDEGNDKRERQKHIERNSGQIDPETAEGVALFPDESANQRVKHRDSRCRGDKILHRQTQRLREVG